MQNWIECNQAPYDDLFYQDLLQEWKLSGSLYDFNDGIARMAFMYSAQVRKEISLLNSLNKAPILKVSEFLRHRDDYDMAILYEDIKADPEAVCKKLLEVCEVPKEHVPLALEALKSDSQGGTFGRRGDKPSVDYDMLMPADKTFQECGLTISSRTTTEEFRRLILTGTYQMRTEYDPPHEIFKTITTGSKSMGLFEVISKFRR